MGKVKCTYKDCFRHFDSEEKMIRHKVKEPSHSYCKVCDEDCENDMYYFIHQLGSAAHTCCPICAEEFKSIATRDNHVHSQHRADSNIQCAGCQEKFRSGGALMQHIEQDECPVIGVQDFQVQRAERQIQKDAWEAEVNPFGITSTTRATSVINTNARSDLLGVKPGDESVHALSSVARGPGYTALPDQYPPLAQSQVSRNIAGQPPQPSILGAKTASNLIDLNAPSQIMSVLDLNQQSWGFQQPAAQSQICTEDTRIKGWLNQVNNTLEPPSENVSAVASLYDKPQATSDLSSGGGVPLSTLTLPNPNAPHQHIINMPAHSMVSTSTVLDIEKYWDPIAQIYACPTTKCKRHFRTVDDFRKHLLSSSHVGGQVTCPSCLKKFATTAAWVAHTESASKRCSIRTSFNYNHVMREITGGVLGTQGFNENGSVKFVAPKIDQWNEDGAW